MSRGMQQLYSSKQDEPLKNLASRDVSTQQSSQKPAAQLLANELT